MADVVITAGERANSRNALIAGFLGWTLDAFDFFILTFVLRDVAKDFQVDLLHMSYTLLASLAMRPVGAFIFGLMADRYGRRVPLMIDVVFYSIVEVLSGLAPSYMTFLILRLLYGIGMGGEWGVGASLVMESVPAKWRGVLSGILQEGYALGNLLAAAAYFLVFPHWGWRAMFFIGGLPALLSLFIRSKVKEPESWRESHSMDWDSYWRSIKRNYKLFAYLVLLMAMMNFISHGTQDLYPTFLQQARNFNPHMTAIITAISMVGAIAGGLAFGLFSDRSGRRRSMVIALVLAVVMIPLWMFAPNTPLVMFGGFAMQFMVQGAWGVIPVHINELSPNELRGFFPGFAYQLGVLIASTASSIEVYFGAKEHLAQTMGIFAATVFLIGAVVVALGPEAKGVHFGKAAQ